MDRYKKMVQHNKANSKRKVEIAIKEIRRMLNNDEQVVVCSLVNKTGLSRAFFYNNSKVHDELVRAQGLQEGKSYVKPQQVILDSAMAKEIDILKKTIKEKDKEIERLKKENTKLNKKADVKLVSVLKGE